MLFYKINNKYKIIMEEKSNINFNIILLGKAGSGKGTQAQKILEKYKNIIHISTGDIFRKEENQKITKAYTDKGELLPKQITIDILKREIEKLKREHHCNKFILDGFPRTPEQAQLLDQIINVEETIAVNFDISNEVATERIMGRAENELKSGRPARNDDLDTKAIQKRLKIYCENYNKIENILTSGPNSMTIVEVEIEEKDKDQVFTELNQALTKLNKQFESTKIDEALTETNDLCEQYTPIK